MQSVPQHRPMSPTKPILWATVFIERTPWRLPDHQSPRGMCGQTKRIKHSRLGKPCSVAMHRPASAKSHRHRWGRPPKPEDLQPQQAGSKQRNGANLRVCLLGLTRGMDFRRELPRRYHTSRHYIAISPNTQSVRYSFPALRHVRGGVRQRARVAVHRTALRARMSWGLAAITFVRTIFTWYPPASASHHGLSVDRGGTSSVCDRFTKEITVDSLAGLPKKVIVPHRVKQSMSAISNPGFLS